MVTLKNMHCFKVALLLTRIPCVARADDSTAEGKAVRQTAEAFATAFNKADAKAVSALWTPDGNYSIGRNTVVGRDAIQKLYEEFFKAHPGSKMTVNIESVRVFAPNVAIEQGTAAVIDSPNGPPTANAYTAIHIQQKDGKWLMASVIESELPSLLKQDLSELTWLVGDWVAQGDSANVEIKYEWMANNNFIRGETKIHAKDGKTEAVGGTQIIGRDPLSEQLVSWYFNADGGHGVGSWSKDGDRWFIQSQGATRDGVPSTSVNAIYRADENVMSWQSAHRTLGGQSLPNTKEIVFERKQSNSAKQ